MKQVAKNISGLMIITGVMLCINLWSVFTFIPGIILIVYGIKNRVNEYLLHEKATIVSSGIGLGAALLLSIETIGMLAVIPGFKQRIIDESIMFGTGVDSGMELFLNMATGLAVIGLIISVVTIITSSLLLSKIYNYRKTAIENLSGVYSPQKTEIENQNSSTAPFAYLNNSEIEKDSSPTLKDKPIFKDEKKETPDIPEPEKSNKNYAVIGIVIVMIILIIIALVISASQCSSSNTNNISSDDSYSDDYNYEEDYEDSDDYSDEDAYSDDYSDEDAYSDEYSNEDAYSDEYSDDDSYSEDDSDEDDYSDDYSDDDI